MSLPQTSRPLALPCGFQKWRNHEIWVFLSRMLRHQIMMRRRFGPAARGLSEFRPPLLRRSAAIDLSTPLRHKDDKSLHLWGTAYEKGL